MLPLLPLKITQIRLITINKSNINLPFFIWFATGMAKQMANMAVRGKCEKELGLMYGKLAIWK